MVKDLYLMDNNKKLLKIINTSTTNEIKVYNDTYTSSLVTGAETYTASFKVPYSEQPLFVEGNYIGFYWQDKFKLMQIKKTESIEKIDDIELTIYAEFIGIELYNCYIDKLVVDGNATKFLTDVLIDTNYKVGYVSPALDSQNYRIEINEITSVYTVIQNATSTLNECEWEFSVEPVNSIQGKYNFYVNCYANGERGTKRYDRFEANKNSYGMKRQGDITNFCSGIIPVGKNGVTITDAKWEKSQGAPLDKPLGQNYLFDPEAHAKLNNGGKYVLLKYKSDAEDMYSLIWDAYYKLQELNQTKFSYEIPVYMTEEKYETIDIGDTNYIVNDKFNPPIQLEGRISQFSISFTDRSKNSVTLANFKEVRSKIKSLNASDIVQDTIREITGMVGKLTQTDIIKIQEYLAKLEVDDAEIEKLIAKYKDKIVPETVTPQDDHNIDDEDIAFDSENYKAIKMSKIDNGLWLGDDRLYEVANDEFHVTKTTTTSTTTGETVSESSSSAKEYNNAVAYYSKFSLGTYSNKSCVNALQSSSNKYKIGTIVKYWSKKFGLDPQLVFAVILAESSGNPYCATKSSAGGYGLMQCERGAYYGHKETIKFLDGSTKTFTPSASTMTPGKGGTTTLNGVKVDKNISNQIMFGCNELRKSLVRFKYNIFAALMGYNFGLYGADWVICKYVCDKYGLTFKDKFGYTAQSSAVQAKYFTQLSTLKCEWSNYRKTYVAQKKMGTASNIEYYLRWYKVVDGQLPYVLDEKGNKKGYGANKTATTSSISSDKVVTTTKTGVATDVRNKIVAKAKEIAALHQTYKKATYCGSYAIYDDSKRYRAKGTINGIKNPYCYVCSSLSSCAYKAAGLSSVVGAAHANCNMGTLVKGATAKSGYVMKKLTSTTIKELLPGDLLMISNGTVPSNLTVSWASAPNGAYSSKGTHHVIVYCGEVNGTRMIAHASGNKAWPRAIRYEKMFDCYSSSYWYTHAFLLRPWDLAAKDAAATKTTTTTKTTTKATKVVTSYELNIKALPGATPGDFINDTKLVQDVTVNNVNNDDKYPSSVSHVLCDFGINDLSDNGMDNYVSLIKALLVKYPKKPIFIAKQYHVTSAYGSDYESLNEQIDNYNNYMKDFANRTQYVIFLGLSSDICSNSLLKSEYTTDSFKPKDKTSREKYYEAMKKNILSKCKGYTTSSTSQSVSVTMQSQKMYKYTKVLKSLTIKLPTNPDDSYYSRIQFTTGSKSEPTKFVQSDLVYLDGLNCKNGALVLKPDTTYNIIIYYNPDTDIADTKYLGSVSGVTKGGKYATFESFKYASDFVKYAKTFYDNRSKFVYNSKCPLDFSKPLDEANKTQWMTNGKYHIDDNCFLQYLMLGWNFNGSHYNPDTTRNNRNKRTATPWAINYLSSEGKIGQYFVQQGWILDGADLNEFTNVKPGDIIFMDSDSKNNGEFMAISHHVIVTSSTQYLQCTNNSNIFEYGNLKDLSQERILFVGRIRID